VDVIEFHTTEAYSNLGLTKVKYKTYKHSMEEGPITTTIIIIIIQGQYNKPINGCSDSGLWSTSPHT
jgi:hypothetical protein